MASPNLFEEIKEALDEFKKFLDDNASTIKPAIAPLDQLTGGRVSELIDSLISLLNKLKAEVDKLDPNLVPGLDKVTTFTESIKTLLESSKSLLPDETDTIDDVIGVADIVTSLPSIDEIKGEITGLIDAIITHLNNLKS
ncbi:MAG: hypothetical protein QNJ45_08555 [Ardenticatenaceae bacterium]|nr:hypothetical protein [Ardenticatenaceae bacterium]